MLLSKSGDITLQEEIKVIKIQLFFLGSFLLCFIGAFSVFGANILVNMSDNIISMTSIMTMPTVISVLILGILLLENAILSIVGIGIADKENKKFISVLLIFDLTIFILSMIFYIFGKGMLSFTEPLASLCFLWASGVAIFSSVFHLAVQNLIKNK